MEKTTYFIRICGGNIPLGKGKVIAITNNYDLAIILVTGKINWLVTEE